MSADTRNPQTLFEVNLTPLHVPTGRTAHRVGNSPIDTPRKLVIAKYSDDDGFYLLYLDADGRELTDTLHDTLDAAMLQANWAFGLKAEEWQRPR